MVSRSTGTSISIQILNNDSLLSIFYLCRPDIFDKSEYGSIWWGNWIRERWWYNLVQVCRRWRHLILGSASHLGLCLVCGRATPVADMLAHSPPLPLIIDHDYENDELAAKDEEGVILALRHHDRVCRINLKMPALSLQKLITALDRKFPMLEYLYIAPPTKHDRNIKLILPPAFEAPQLRLIILNHFTPPIEAPLLATSMGISTLALRWIRPSAYLHPNDLLQSLSLLHNLETLEIGFFYPVPIREIERQLSHTPTIACAIFPNLQWFSFWGISNYLEALLPHMTAPVLEKFRVHFFNQQGFSVPHLLQFMENTSNLKFRSIRILFYHKAVAVFVGARVETVIEDFFMQILCRHLDWQVYSMAQIFHTLSPLLSSVEELNLDYRAHTLSSEGHNEVDYTLWCKLLGSCRSIKTLRVHRYLVEDISRSLNSDGDSNTELLPELRELIYPMGSVGDKTFATFVHEHELAGNPVKLIRERSPADPEIYFFYSSESTSMYTVNSDPTLPR